MNNLKAGLCFLIGITTLIFSVIIYDGVVNEPIRKQACAKINSEIFHIYQKGDFCRTPDGRIVYIPNVK